MRKNKRKRTTSLIFPDGLTSEQLQTLQGKRFMFGILVAPGQPPQLAYLIQCFTCHQKVTLEVTGRKPLTQDQLHLELLLRGLNIAGRGTALNGGPKGLLPTSGAINHALM